MNNQIEIKRDQKLEVKQKQIAIGDYVFKLELSKVKKGSIERISVSNIIDNVEDLTLDEIKIKGNHSNNAVIKFLVEKNFAYIKKDEYGKDFTFVKLEEFNEYLQKNRGERLDRDLDVKDKNLQELIEQIPGESREKFKELFQKIPEKFKDKYKKILESAINNKDEVSKRTTIRGLIFELSRINTLINQGFEQIDLNLEIPEEIEYFGFDKNTKDFNQEITQKLKSQIQLDVPIARNGEPFVYEVKNYPRMSFGSIATQRNQLLKYQSAIEQGVVDGASIEIKGRIDPNFLRWATGTSVADLGKIPDVEIIYNFDLPSGSEYRFVLKRSRKNNGLKFENEGRSPTIESTLKSIKENDQNRYDKLIKKFGTDDKILEILEEDRKVINSIQRSVLDRKIIDIITNVDIKNPSPELQPYISDPMTIKSSDLFDQYEDLRNQSIYRRLLTTREIINSENKRNVLSEFANRQYVEKSVREYQDYLKQNPEMAKVKKAYVLDSEEDVLAVIDKVMLSIENIKKFELDRVSDEKDSDISEKRKTMGYVGLPEGVTLDIEHITIDAIQEINKKKGKAGRSYDEPERFKKVESLEQYLENQDRRYLEIAIYDPVSNKTERNTDVNDAHIKRTFSDLLKENIKRAETRIQEINNRLIELNQKTEKTDEEFDEIKQLNSRIKARNMNAVRVERIKHLIEELKANKGKQIGLEKDNSRKKIIASEFDEDINKNMEELSMVYKEILGGQKEWDKFAKIVSEKIDQNIIKFIYVVKSDGEIVVDEEVVRGEASGRAAHSELAQGRNIYGAGELVFEKGADGKWSLNEINNGSGHYRPSANTLVYVKNLLQSKGIDVAKANINDTLLRGVSLRDLTMLEE